MRPRPIPLLTLAVAVAACETTPVPAPEPAEAVTSHPAHAGPTEDRLPAVVRQEIASVRKATARFHDLERALDAGYSVQFPEGCMETEDGAQGFHYLNPALVDVAVDPLQPELLMYEPRRDGSLQLIGVDYVIPIDAWQGNDPPSMLGQPFTRNEGLGVWALHIWAWRPNPSGIFANWNPAASCAHAG